MEQVLEELKHQTSIIKSSLDDGLDHMCADIINGKHLNWGPASTPAAMETQEKWWLFGSCCCMNNHEPQNICERRR